MVAQWIKWFAPAVQPFLASGDLAGSLDEPTVGVSLSDEVRDTYCLYGLPSGLEYVWLSEAQFRSLARPQRAALVRAQRAHGRELVPSVRAWADALGDEIREQADGHRFVWWRS